MRCLGTQNVGEWYSKTSVPAPLRRVGDESMKRGDCVLCGASHLTHSLGYIMGAACDCPREALYTVSSGSFQRVHWPADPGYHFLPALREWSPFPVILFLISFCLS